MHTTHFGTDVILNSEFKIEKLIPDKIKNTSTLSVFKSKIKSWSIDSCCPCRLCKVFVKHLGFVEVCPSLQWNPRK